MLSTLPSSQGEKFPHTIAHLTPALNRQLLNDFTGVRSGFVRVEQDGWLLPGRYEAQALGYYTLPLRPDDIWIQTFPRSGTTWCQEMVWLINNNFDYETAKKIPLYTRFPFLEFGMIHHPELHEEVLALNGYRSDVAEVLERWRTPGAQLAGTLSSPRHFKTHLPFALLPPQLVDTCKVIYVARNPLDVAVSFFHHNRYMAVIGYTGDFQKYWQYFREDLVVYSPYWKHVKQAWAKRNHPNFLFLFYEDLLLDLPKNIRIICDFLGKKIDEDQLSKLTTHLQIDNFRNNVQVHTNVEIKGLTREHEQGFIRKGKLKGNSEFTEEVEAEANKWVNENLADTDLRFPTSAVASVWQGKPLPGALEQGDALLDEKFPHTIQHLPPAVNRRLMDDFTGERSGFVRVGQARWLLPARYEAQALGYYTLPLRPDDIWIQTFPRSGTTWCQEMVWLINNNFDYETAKKIPLSMRYLFLEYGALHHPELHEELLALNDHHHDVVQVLEKWRTPGFEQAGTLSSPRHFKTHLPLPLLPPQLLDTCKVIYVARNPLDVAVSYFHHNRYLAIHGYNGDFQQYWRYFRDDLLVYSPYWEHVKQAWARRSHPNFLLLFYEDLLKDLPKNIRIISDFLGKKVNEEQLLKLTDHLQIDNFRKNVPLLSNFEIKGLTREHEQGLIRKGKLKGNSEFTEDLEAEANKWVNENLADTDLRFPTK